MVVTCEIKFDDNINGTYFTGEMVNGMVILKANKSKDVKGVLLKISGYAVTRWSERHRGRLRHYSGRDDYMESVTYLLGSADSNKTTIQAGEHTYTFACQLPYNCPSSFEGLHGCIRYVVKVVLVRPWKFDQTYTRGFTVIKMMDLNYDTPQLRMPNNSEAYKTFCCGPCKTDPLNLKLHVPQTGFVPGQTIPVSVVVINNTNMTVASVKFSLVMLVRYFSTWPLKNSCIEPIVVTKTKGELVLRNFTRLLTAELYIPATPPTCLNVCSVIQIVYQVEVEAKMEGWSANQVVTMPVTIGTVPLLSNTMVINQQPTLSGSRAMGGLNAVSEEKQEALNGDGEQQKSGELPVMEPIAVGVPATTSMDIYENMPPPSYEESLHTVRGDINEEELHAFGTSEFAPLYPVYNISNQTFDVPKDTERGAYVNQNFES